MPYKDKGEDTKWHREKMRERRELLRLADELMKLNMGIVTPDVTPKLDADGNAIPEY